MAGKNKIQIVQIKSISIDRKQFMINYWDPQKNARSIHHVPSKKPEGKEVIVDRCDAIRICDPAFPTNNSRLIRFNKHIYEALFNMIPKEKYRRY